MKKILFVLLLVCSVAMAGMFDSEEFLPPVEGGPEKISGDVQVLNDQEILAQNAQDGLNKANNLLWEAYENVGFKVVYFGSGEGYIAGGTASYQVHPNVNATLIEKRMAFLEAYYQAKRNLMQGINGFSTEKKEGLQQEITSADNSDSNIGGFYSYQDESINQSVSDLLKGYVTYDVRDEAGKTGGRVFVSLAASLKTMEDVSRPSEGIFVSRLLEDGLKKVVIELENGLVPPVGGRIISVPVTDQFAVVAFGSAIARYSENKLTAAKYQEMAIEFAKARASQALVDILYGSNDSWTSGFNSTTLKTDFSDFSEVKEMIPELEPEDEEIINNAKSNFINFVSMTEDYKSVSSGKVPPKTIIRVAMDPSVKENGYGWVYAMAVYYPPIDVSVEDLFTKKDIEVKTYEKPLSENPGWNTSGQVTNDDDL
ncbi:MAG: hypothetical protein U9N62_08725 [Thermotogota bacterium]|nr:hypothetical protein [Thermotogota bacterium]